MKSPVAADQDNDGFVSCDPSGGWFGSTLKAGNDCDDSDPELNPSTTWYRDEDGDGYGELAASCLSALHLMVIQGCRRLRTFGRFSISWSANYYLR